MRKILYSFLLAFTTILMVNATVLAEDSGNSADGIVEVYKVDDSFSAGYQHHLGNNVYFTVNLENLEVSNDLKLQLGAIYRLSHPVLFFDVYGGGGAQISRKENYEYPYLVLGGRILIFFYEMVYPWKEQVDPVHRAGLSFSI